MWPLGLLVFNGLPGGLRRGLDHIYALACVRVELLLNSSLCFRLLDVGMKRCRELHITVLADSERRNVLDAPNDPKIPLWHEDSLRRR